MDVDVAAEEAVAEEEVEEEVVAEVEAAEDEEVEIKLPSYLTDTQDYSLH